MVTIALMPDTVQAALYQRVSTKDQDHTRQNQANAEAAARNGWTATEYDDKISASRFSSSKTRPDYERLLADIRAGRVDVLVLWEPSRGSRELEQWAALLNLCRRRDVLVHVTAHGRTYDLSNAREWRGLAEDGIDSQFESEKLSARIRDGKHYWGVTMGHPQAKAVYGIRRTNDPSKARNRWISDDPDPDTGPVVAEIIRRVGAGEAYQAIADDLNRRSEPSPSGGRWTREAIRTIASREVYAQRGVVSEAESLRARTRLTDVARKGERPSAARFRYSELITCSTCGRKVRGKQRGSRDIYTCRGHAARTAYGTGAIDAAAADKFIDAVVVERLSRPDAVTMFATADDGAVLAARSEAERCRQKIAEATESYSADRIGIESLEAITAAMQPKIASAEKRAAALAVPSPLADLVGGSKAMVARRWAGLSLGQRKAAVRALMPDLTLVPGSADAPPDERIIPWPASRVS